MATTKQVLVGLVVGIFFAGLGGLSVGYQWLMQPVGKSPETVVVVIKKGQSVDSIGQMLTEKRLIRSPLAFKLAVLQGQLATKIQAGTFKLSPAMSVMDMAQNLTKGTLDTWVTILEGWRREEIAQALATAFMETGSQFDEDKFLAVTKEKEGYLFPDTYLLPLGADPVTIALILTNTFEKKVTRELKQELDTSGRSMTAVLTMASLIEREARTDEARKMVAGILWKRLDNNWPLQVDATLQYALGYDRVQKTWWKPPLAADKEIKSPYNTYQNQGLPPGPICSPSLSSIKAALSPTPSEYWYYITDPRGNMHYAATNEEHIQNVNTYLG